MAAPAALVRGNRADRASTVSAWVRDGVFEKLHREVAIGVASATRLDGSDPGRGKRAGEKGGSLTDPSPVYRDKKGSKIQLLLACNPTGRGRDRVTP